MSLRMQPSTPRNQLGDREGASRTLSLLNEFAQWSVPVDGIHDVFGEKVNGRQDIAELDLEEVDRAIGFLAAKYKGIAFAEGATAGVLGLPAIPSDVIAVLGLNLRAIVRLTFQVAVAGPIVLGRDRHLGGGLFQVLAGARARESRISLSSSGGPLFPACRA